MSPLLFYLLNLVISSWKIETFPFNNWYYIRFYGKSSADPPKIINTWNRTEIGPRPHTSNLKVFKYPMFGPQKVPDLDHHWPLHPQQAGQPGLCDFHWSTFNPTTGGAEEGPKTCKSHLARQRDHRTHLFGLASRLYLQLTIIFFDSWLMNRYWILTFWHTYSSVPVMQFHNIF